MQAGEVAYLVEPLEDKRFDMFLLVIERSWVRSRWRDHPKAYVMIDTGDHIYSMLLSSVSPSTVS